MASANNDKILWNRDEDLRLGTKNGVHPPMYGATLGGQRGKVMPTGFHHIALVCKNMKETIRFYEGALGMKLRAIYPMHGIKGAKHCFLEAGNGNEISFVEFQDPVPSVNPPSFFQVWPIGMHHHMAYRCETEEQLLPITRADQGIWLCHTKVVDHDFIKSVYFTDPSGYNLELTWTYRGYKDSEYDLTVLDRRLRDDENTHAESDKARQERGQAQQPQDREAVNDAANESGLQG